MDPSSSPASNANPSTSTLSHRPASRRQTDSPGSRTSSNNNNTPIPDEEHGADMPMTMSASVVLTSLPRDAHQALADAENIDTGKGMPPVLSQFSERDELKGLC